MEVRVPHPLTVWVVWREQGSTWPLPFNQLNCLAPLDEFCQEHPDAIKNSETFPFHVFHQMVDPKHNNLCQFLWEEMHLNQSIGRICGSTPCRAIGFIFDISIINLHGRICTFITTACDPT